MVYRKFWGQEDQGYNIILHYYRIFIYVFFKVKVKGIKAVIDEKNT